MNMTHTHIPAFDTDVLVIGSGLAGMCAALALAPLNVTLVTPNQVGRGGSSEYAKGGIAASVTKDDTPAMHMTDTINAGAGLTDQAVASAITRLGPECITWLEHQGVHFDCTADGALALGREGAHRMPRIVHIQGDQTGRYMTRALAHRIMTSDHITVLSQAKAESLLTCTHGWVRGARLVHKGRPSHIHARHVVLSTGGIGGMFRHTTNPTDSVGRGLALAARVGARLVDLEFVQFHPTALNVDADPLPLMTEALRGAGARLVSAAGAGIMDTVDKRGDLAPRDVVASALWQRQLMGQPSYLDGRQLRPETWLHDFPSALEACKQFGIDPVTQLVPITPAAHYHMGGIETDTFGQTNIPGLWALGECASTGLHGANRLASNSLLEAVAVARNCASAIQDIATLPQTPGHDLTSSSQTQTSKKFWPWLRQGMWRALGVEREGATMADWQTTVRSMRNEKTRRSQEEQDAMLLADMMTTAALARSESRGGHRRSDIPQSDPNQVGRLRVTADEQTLSPVLTWSASEKSHEHAEMAVA